MSDLREDVKQELDNLLTLRDEVRVRLHLGNQEAKEKWASLETELNRMRDNAARTTKHSLDELKRAVKEFQKQLQAET